MREAKEGAGRDRNTLFTNRYEKAGSKSWGKREILYIAGK